MRNLPSIVWRLVVAATMIVMLPGAPPPAQAQSAIAPAKSFPVAHGQAVKLGYDGASLDGSTKAITTQTTITIDPLSQNDVPMLSTGMKNVTAGPRRGYRFLPHSTHFGDKLTVSVPYDPALIPDGLTVDDVKTFFFDDQSGTWQELDRVKVDAKNQLIVSTTDHFTDMINAAVTVPDHAQGTSFNPNSIKDLKAADPSAGINLIEAPQANNKGEARLSYPIELPPGRQGMQPSLALTYNSSGGNGWLGIGWDLQSPTISVDTRWGVPRYGVVPGLAGLRETESYLLSGEQLTPLAHRDDVPAPRATGDKTFQTRVESTFLKIVRHGDLPSNNSWEVTDKQGVQYFYGGCTETSDPTTACTLRDGAGNIFRWALREVRDRNGNGVKYSYTRVSDVGLDGGTVPGSQLYLTGINYTQSNGSPGPYDVTFKRASELGQPRRPDVTIDAHGGFKMVTADLLQRLDVTLNGQLIRRYDLQYEQGAFKKTLLKSITQSGEDGSPFNTHELTYYDDVRTGPTTYDGFAPAVNWNTGGDKVDWSTKTGTPNDVLLGPLGDFLGFGGASAISGSIGDKVGGHVYVGFNIASPTKNLSAGGKIGFNFSDDDTVLLLNDINGDGLPDKLYKNQDGAVYFRLNQPDANGQNTFGTPTPITTLSDLSKESSITTSFGGEVYVGVGNVGVNGLINHADTFTTGSVYFSDVNGDGLPDLVNNGTVLFNHRDANGTPTFTANSSDTPVSIGKLSVDGNGIVEDLDSVYQAMIDNNPLVDTVRRWTAPYSGTIAISGDFHLIQDASPARAKYQTADGVRVAIQKNDTELFSQTIPASDYTAKSPSGVGSVSVTAGDHIYFRVGSTFDGKYDQVVWDPVVAYQNLAPVTDVNLLDAYTYQSSKDFTLAGRRDISVQMPFDGTVHMAGALHKSGATSDDVTLVVLKRSSGQQNDVVIFSQDFAWNQTGDFNLPPDFTVAQNDVIKLRVKVDSPIDVSKLQWNPDLYYTTVTGPADRVKDTKVQDTHGNYLIQLNPPYDIDLYPDSNLTAPQPAFVAPQDGTLTAETLLGAVDPSATGSVAFTIKKPGELRGRGSVLVTNGSVSNVKVSVNVTKGDVLFFDYSAYDPDLAAKLGNKLVRASFGTPGTDPTFIVPSAFHSATRPDVFAQSYRGWASVGYNGNRARATQPIVESDLKIQFDQNTKYDPRTAKAYLFYPAPDQNRWNGPDESIYVAKDAASSSRLGLDFPTVPAPGSLAGAQGVSRLSRTDQEALGGGATVGPLNLTGSKSVPAGTSYNELDYLDMNGDGFPDIVANGHIQYTTPRGGLEEKNRAIAGLERARESTNNSSNFGVGGSATFSKGGAKGEVDTTGNGAPREESNGSQMVKLGLGASLGSGDSDVQFDLIDINGDGLPDRVTKNGVKASCGNASLCVAFNLGYGFAPFEPWGNVPVAAGASHNFAVQGSLGFNDGIYGFSGGLSLDENASQGGCSSIDFVSLSTACEKPAPMLVDVNGDGLLDRVDANGSSLKVAFNTGNGFARLPGGGLELADWTGALDAGVAKTANTSLGAGVYFTIGIGPLCLAGCYLIVNPGADFARSLSRTETVIRDVDGDGYPDHLASTSDGTLTVARNRIGRTNLLKSVTRPLGATFNLDYERSGNTYQLPHSHWVLSKVTVFDGHPGDGDAQLGAEFRTMLTAYQYEKGMYNRLEREFYGFGKVVEEHRNPANGDLYRQVVREFLTDGFYTKDLLHRELTLDSAGHPFLEQEQKYLLRDVGTGIEPVDGQSASASIFPQLVRTDRRFYEGKTPATKSTYTTQNFDALGNVVEFFDAAEPGTNTDDVTATLTYSACQGTYIVGVPVKIVVVGNGAEMRHREGNVDCATGNVTQVRQYLANAGPAVTDLTYFANGTVHSVLDPLNLHGNRASETYDYDPIIQAHVTKVTDNLGYSSSTTYNLKYGAVETQLDLNNNKITNAYDVFGRLVSVTGPYEQGGATPTIRFEYHPNGTDPWALTRHFDALRDPSGGDTIDTVLFIDGLKRALQTKKDATIFAAANSPAENKMTVSGHVTFDFVGRAVDQFYPTTEPQGSAGTFNHAVDGVDPTHTEFDVLNRPTKVTLPDSRFVTTAYDFGTDRENALQFKTTVTDENGVRKQTYHDVRELVTGLEQFNNGGAQVIWTSYAFDPMKQLIQIKDAKDNLTKLGYDNLGRRTLVDNEDSGATETVFDLASNMTKKITANLKAQNAAIAYDYDALNRLTTISYPNFPANNITYMYGAPGAADNRAARITLVHDQSGSAERFYGKLGELTREVKTVVGFTGAPPNTYTTQYVSDTFGRLRTLTYPDGEVLTYQYDAGGLLRQATGQKGPNAYAYLKRMEYDKFGQRSFVEDGNGVRSQYTYDPASRRLQNLLSTQSNGTPFQNLVYGYDNVGNVLSLSNQVPLPAASQFGGPTSQTFTYDDLYRVTAASGTFQFAPGKTNEYTLALSYDTIHNTLAKTQTNTVVQPSATPITQHKTTYDFAYLYQSPRPHAATHVDDRTFTYDANGNQSGWTNDLNGTRRTIVWDDENRVQSVFDNGHEMAYKYDDKGERVVKRGPQGETAYINQFYTVRNGQLGTKHFYADDTRLVSKLVQKDPTVVEKDQFFFHADHLGSSNFVTDAAGALYEHMEYFPFGETWVQESTNTQRTPYLFTGKELDEETGLYYYSARYYDPRTSQFISTDPLVQSDPDKVAEMPATLDLYAYVANNPLRYTDPTGRVLTVPRQAALIMNTMQMLTNDKLGLVERPGGYSVVITEFAKNPNKPAGTELIRNLIQTQKVISVQTVNDGTSRTRPISAEEKKATGTDADVEVLWNPTSSDEFVLTDKGRTIAGKQPPQMHLGHEFIHSDRFAKGIAHTAQYPLSRKFLTPWGTTAPEKVGEEEWFVIGFGEKEAKKQGLSNFTASKITEQMLAKEQNLPVRGASSTISQIRERGD
jgi:RHS repeat-associated protein